MDDMRRAAGGAGPGADDPYGLPPNFVPLRLVVQPTGVVVELTRPDMLLGRHSEADVRLPLPDVSRRHCRFECESGRWFVIDLDSLNGVYVNDALVRRAELRHGDKLRIGGFTFGVDLSPAAATDGVLDAAEGVLLSITHALPPPEGNDRREAS